MPAVLGIDVDAPRLCMTLLQNLHQPAHSPFFSLFPKPTTSKCLNGFARSIASEAAKPQWVTRCIRVKNLPSTFTVAKLVTLKGFGRPIESVIILPDSSEREIRYLQNGGAALAVKAAREGDVVLDGQKLEVKLWTPQPLPVEIIAAVALRSASQILWLQPPEHFKTEAALEQEVKRFGEVESIWIDESKGRAQVTFGDIRAAMKACKSLLSEKAWEGCTVSFYSQQERIYPREDGSKHQGHPHTVYLSHLPPNLASQQLSKSLKDVLDWKYGEPLMRLFINEDGAFLTFRNSDAAKNFYDTYEPAGSTQKSWHRPKPPLLCQVAAANLGATRTLCIVNFDVQRIWPGRIRVDFSKFGGIVRTEVDAKNRLGFVEFMDILDACKAIEYIRENKGDFSIYAGSKIGFWHNTRPRFGRSLQPKFLLRYMEFGGTTSLSSPIEELQSKPGSLFSLTL
ncbi:hypothetical protein D9758_005807 [Tetrapyrgos nigripes]|uniref:RRM domain-containing protein n=1 Tax=Tetrapyrgos nigripes TaxID=182062 RepID=A0A8H5GJN0_9AGAR|nr:hypothetical protein D9758_005807 [Tetrapyrgos nigripes]